MREFLGAATAFPAVLFSFALVVVIGYWVLVLVGGIGHGGAGTHGGGHGGGHHGGGRHGFGGLLDALGLGGVPVTVAVSLLIAFAWFSALAGTVLLHHRYPLALLAAALVAAWASARALAWPLRRILPTPEIPPSRTDFVGRSCVIRTGRVGPDFGQAEVRAEDGSAALVQVRQSGEDAAGPGAGLTTGAHALIYDYDAEGEFFRVMPEVSSG